MPKTVRKAVEPKKLAERDLYLYELDDSNLLDTEAVGKRMDAVVEKALFIDAEMVPFGREVFARSVKDENLFLFGRCFPHGFGSVAGACIQAKTSGKFCPTGEDYFIIGILRGYGEPGTVGQEKKRGGVSAPHR